MLRSDVGPLNHWDLFVLAFVSEKNYSNKLDKNEIHYFNPGWKTSEIELISKSEELTDHESYFNF